MERSRDKIVLRGRRVPQKETPLIRKHTCFEGITAGMGEGYCKKKQTLERKSKDEEEEEEVEEEDKDEDAPALL